jgi:hypothetical protein
MKKPDDEAMLALFYAAIRSAGNTILILGDSPDGFAVYPPLPPPSEFIALTHAHSTRLRALLDKPVILAVHWNAGDRAAIVQIMPTKSRPDEKFVEFTLPFPDRKPVIMM